MARNMLVLGAYGHVGTWIVPELVKLDCIGRLVATGRKKAMLDSRLAGIGSTKLEMQTLDAFDKPALRAACKGMDFFINCVGPYAWRGSEIAAEVVGQGVNYVDFANEQSHYHRLLVIGADAERNGLVLVTGAGTSPGVSTALFQMGKEAVPAARTFEMFYASGRHPSRVPRLKQSDWRVAQFIHT